MPTTKLRLDEFVCKKIHYAIHSDADNVVIDGVSYPIGEGSNGCRKVNYGDITFMEQNEDKNSRYAERARNGENITWGMRNPEQWILIADGNDKIKGLEE